MMIQAGPPSQWAEQELWFLGKEPEELQWKLQDSGGSQGSQERLWLQLPQLSVTSPKLGVALAWLSFRRSFYSVYPWERQILCTSQMKRKENGILLSLERWLFLLPALILQEWENLVTKGTLQSLSIKNTLKKYNPSRFLSSKDPLPMSTPRSIHSWGRSEDSQAHRAHSSAGLAQTDPTCTNTTTQSEKDQFPCSH